MPTSSQNAADKENIYPNPPPVTPAPEIMDEKKVKKQCMWSMREKGLMLNVLAIEKAAGNQSESGWKASVWEKVAEKLAKEGDEMFPVKTASKCQDAFTKVREVSPTI